MELNALELVRQRTADAHAALERRMFVDRIMDGSLTPAQLISLLQVNHHFLACVERNAQRYPELAAFIVPRAELAANDLRRMGASPLPTSDLMDQWDLDRMYGALYVALGSLLGGAVITARLRPIDSLPKDLTFYAQDREAMGVWKNFIEVLRNRTDVARNEVLAQGALATFALADDACTLAAVQPAPAV